jgi:hypothetical protein
MASCHVCNKRYCSCHALTEGRSSQAASRELRSKVKASVLTIMIKTVRAFCRWQKQGRQVCLLIRTVHRIPSLLRITEMRGDIMAVESFIITVVFAHGLHDVGHHACYVTVFRSGSGNPHMLWIKLDLIARPQARISRPYLCSTSWGSSDTGRRPGYRKCATENHNSVSECPSISLGFPSTEFL